MRLRDSAARDPPFHEAAAAADDDDGDAAVADDDAEDEPMAEDDARADMTALEFVVNVLRESPHPKQADMLQAVSDARRASVVGCHGSGKDWAAARAALWWICAMSPAIAIVTGPTLRQVKDIVWKELRYAHGAAARKLGGRMFLTPRYEADHRSFALGFTSNSPEYMQGFHSSNLLVAITEAHAVEDGDIDAMRRLNPSRLLMTGNPMENSGAFFDSHHSRRELYATAQISAPDAPNISATGEAVMPGVIAARDADDRKLEWGEDSPQYIGGVLGRFPDNLENAIVPLRAATAAARRQPQPDADPNEKVVVACDVARFGRDKTVIVQRQGSAARIVQRMRGSDTMQVAGALAAHCRENRVNTLVIDDTGVGGGVYDRLRELNLPNARLVRFTAGANAAQKEQFQNRAAEAWWAMRQWYLNADPSTDDDPELIAQVSTRRYGHDSAGRIGLKSKRNQSGSPDEADALAMTFAEVRASEGKMKVWI